ncbi:MAG TPA: serine hydrolase domain-containing protein [Gemmatimonadales bacterium]|nr:serine hydrolase domain-containing protein [Gemmatimonadales bacterium]
MPAAYLIRATTLCTLLAAATLAAASLAPAPLAAQSPPPAPAALASRLTRLLDTLAAADRFAGVVLLAKEGRPVFERAYGLADREKGRPNDLGTRFNLGSINKLFTTIAIRQLAAAGTLQLDSTLAYAWPDYPNPDVARRVTIRQLLEHRSGVDGDIFAAPASGNRAALRRLRDFLPLFVDAPLAFAPGTQQRYSNAGYVVLGLLIERVTGQPYYDYVREHVYAPAGMTQTAHDAKDSLAPNTAIPYTRGWPAAPESTPARRADDELPGRGSSAGGGYSNATDLLRFIRAARAGKIPGAPVGRGFGVAGGTRGVNSVIESGLPGGYDLIVLTNLDPPAAQRVAREVRGWLGARE